MGETYPHYRDPDREARDRDQDDYRDWMDSGKEPHPDCDLQRVIDKQIPDEPEDQ